MSTLKIILIILACLPIVSSMSVDVIFTAVNYSINFNSRDLINIMNLLDLHTQVPANGFDFINLNNLINVISASGYNFELGYALIHGVCVYAINIGGAIYSIDPETFHSLIYILIQ